LAGNTKPWTIHRDVVNLVTKEFFAQGDRERLELNKEPNVKRILALPSIMRQIMMHGRELY
jgi:hypothetical protein